MSNEKKIVEALTANALVDKYISEAGHNAIVKREHVETDERDESLKEVLKDIGRDIQGVGRVPKGMQYMGSIACHIYKSEVLQEAAFYKQIVSDSEQNIALLKAAALELAGEIDFALTGRRGTKRSGFSG